jgi:hypothetical protein
MTRKINRAQKQGGVSLSLCRAVFNELRRLAVAPPLPWQSSSLDRGPDRCMQSGSKERDWRTTRSSIGIVSWFPWMQS